MDCFGGLPDVQQQGSWFYDLELSDIISLSGLSESTLPVARESSECSQRKSSRQSTQHDVTAQDEHQSHELQMTEHPRKRRNQPARTHNSSEIEKRRRERIEAKMKLLRQLIPNSDKLDKASLLDKAIYHIKALKWQLQVMQAMGRVPLQSIPPSGMLQCPGTAEQLSIASGIKPGGVRLGACMIPDVSATVRPPFGAVPFCSSSLPPVGYYYVSPFLPANTPYLNWPI